MIQDASAGERLKRGSGQFTPLFNLIDGVYITRKSELGISDKKGKIFFDLLFSCEHFLWKCHFSFPWKINDIFGGNLSRQSFSLLREGFQDQIHKEERKKKKAQLINETPNFSGGKIIGQLNCSCPSKYT